MRSRTPIVNKKEDQSSFPRGRNREFSEIRQVSSQRPRTSRLTHEKSITELSHSRINRSRLDKNELRNEENEHNRSHIGESPSKIVCVGCFNKELHCIKKNKEKEVSQLKKQPTNLTIINDNDEIHKQAVTRYEREVALVNNYNQEQYYKRMRNMREEEKNNKEKDHLKMQHFMEENKENQRKTEQLRVKEFEQLKRYLQDQMETKKKKQSLDNETRKPPIEPIFCEPNRELMHHILEENYKNELKSQINEIQKKKEVEQREEIKRKKEEEYRIMQEAVQNEKYKQSLIERRQKEIEESIREAKKLEEGKRIAREKELFEDEREVKLFQKHYEEERKQKEEIRRQRLTNYVNDLKVQMNINDNKRKHEFECQNEPTSLSFIKNEKPIQRECESCDKMYPESYLTRLAGKIRQD